MSDIKERINKMLKKSEPILNAGKPNLLPCPFCNGEAMAYEAWTGAWYVLCDCGCRLGDFDTEAEAVEAWNKRVPPTEEQLVAYIDTTRIENMKMLNELKKKHHFQEVTSK